MAVPHRPDTQTLREPPQALVQGATVTAVRGGRERWPRFGQRSRPRCDRQEQRANARVVGAGRLSGLERKTAEPSADQAGWHRKPIQHVVGAGAGDEDAVMAEVRRPVGEELGDPEAVRVLDPSAVPTKGDDSWGVQRPWCGRRGQIDHCRVGVFRADAAPGGTRRWTAACTCRASAPETGPTAPRPAPDRYGITVTVESVCAA